MSEAANAKTPDPDLSEFAAKVRPSRAIPALIGLNSLMLVGVMVVLFLQMNRPPPAAAAPAPAATAQGAEHAADPAQEHAEPGPEAKDGTAGKPGAVKGLGPLVKLADFVIHLRNPEIDRYARLSFDVEVFGEFDKDSLNANMPRVRDAFIAYLSDRTLEELQGAEGLTRTKEALHTRMRELVPQARIRNIYISDFVVQ